MFSLLQITLDGCKDLTDNELYLIAKTMGPFCEINMRGTSLRYITDIERNRVNCLGCTILGTDSIGMLTGKGKKIKINEQFGIISPGLKLLSSFASVIQCIFFKDLLFYPWTNQI